MRILSLLGKKLKINLIRFLKLANRSSILQIGTMIQLPYSQIFWAKIKLTMINLAMIKLVMIKWTMIKLTTIKLPLINSNTIINQTLLEFNNHPTNPIHNKKTLTPIPSTPPISSHQSRPKMLIKVSVQTSSNRYPTICQNVPLSELTVTQKIYNQSPLITFNQHLVIHWEISHRKHTPQWICQIAPKT
jgi:hypothetical protein